MTMTCYEWCKARKIDWRDKEANKEIGMLYYQYLCSHLTNAEYSSLQAKFEEGCSSMPGFCADKDGAGNYSDGGTFSAWEGFIDSELQRKQQSI